MGRADVALWRQWPAFDPDVDVRVVYLANNRLGLEVLKVLKGQGCNLVGLGLHPIERRRFGDELLELADLRSEEIILGDTLKDAETTSKLRQLAPDLILSVLFGYVLPPEILDIPSKGCVNLHPSFLPYNRGAYPNVWSIVEETPAGVTLHYMDKGLDTGAIISQRRVDVSPVDTGESLYAKLDRAALDLFSEYWPRLREGRVDAIPQARNDGTYHRSADVEEIDEIKLDATYSARQLIDVVRARTFPPHKGAYFIVDGRRVHMELRLTYGDDQAEDEKE